MKRILMIGTGGTIASGKTAEGLMPELTSEQLLSFVPAVSSLCRAECLQLLSLDSTNLAPTHWLLIAQAIREQYDRYDGFVISHGTDTMAYTAAALSYLIQGTRAGNELQERNALVERVIEDRLGQAGGFDVL